MLKMGHPVNYSPYKTSCSQKKYVFLLLQIKKRVSLGNSGGGDSPSGVYPFFLSIKSIITMKNLDQSSHWDSCGTACLVNIHVTIRPDGLKALDAYWIFSHDILSFTVARAKLRKSGRTAKRFARFLSQVTQEQVSNRFRSTINAIHEYSRYNL